MPYALLKALAPAEFKRFSGVHRATFEKMLEALGGGSGERRRAGVLRNSRWQTNFWWRYSIGGNIGPIFTLRCRGVSLKRRSVGSCRESRIPEAKTGIASPWQEEA